MNADQGDQRKSTAIRGLVFAKLLAVGALNLSPAMASANSI